MTDLPLAGEDIHKSLRGMRSAVLLGWFGKLWSAVLNIVCLPLYIKVMGLSAYGAVALFVSFQGILMVLDCGISATVCRHLARSGEQLDGAALLVFRTLEFAAWLSAALVIIVAMGCSTRLSTWLGADDSLPPVVRISLVAVALTLQLPITFYFAALLGLQRYRLHAISQIIWGTLKVAGALLAFSLFTPTFAVYIYWQATTSIIVLLAIGALVRSQLPRLPQFRLVDKKTMREMWSFGLVMGGYSITAAVLGQLDKIVLNSVLSPVDFGLYAFASNISLSLLMLCAPISTAITPILARSVASGEGPLMNAAFHQASQVLCVVVIPISTALIAFAPSILFAWTGDRNLSESLPPILRPLVGGVTFSLLLSVPFALQVAFGAPGLFFLANILASLILFLGLPITGAIGPSAASILLMSVYACYFCICAPIVLKRNLALNIKRWFFADVLKPALISLGVVMVAIALLNTAAAPPLFIAATVLVAVVSCVACAEHVKPMLRGARSWRALD